MIAGFELPTEGTVLLDGRDVSELAPYQRDVNTVFQDYALFPHMSVGDNVAYGLMVKRVRKQERSASGWPRRCGWCACDGLRASASRRSSRAASGSASRWRGRSSTARGCCCWTSRWARST